MLDVHIVSFEGPDAYSRAGGIASRVTGLCEALGQEGNQSHLWFVGDPAFSGHERDGAKHLHRWCQWISAYHPAGVYDGEEGKVRDFSRSLPPYLLRNAILPALSAGRRVAVLAEEWQTADAVLHLDGLLRKEGVRDGVRILWNANNTFGFDGIDWPRLDRAAEITTVSLYMRHLMRQRGVDATVIHNGIEPAAFSPVDEDARRVLAKRFAKRAVLSKVARFDPDKRWLLAVDMVAELKRANQRPLFVARGGIEAHGDNVFASARARGLRVVDRVISEDGAGGVLAALQDCDDIDVVNLRSPLDAAARSLLLAESACVLVNSGHEPFGLVGLETMAAGGVACTGGSGEDYAVHGKNALVFGSQRAADFVPEFLAMRETPAREHELRCSARRTAQEFSWSRVIGRELMPQLAA